MKKILFLGLLTFLFSFMSHPAKSEVFLDYGFPNPPVWQAGGFEVYDVMDAGQKIGHARVDYKRITMMGQPALKAHFIESWTDGNGVEYSTDIDSNCLVSALSVTTTTRIDTVGEETWRYEGNYTGSSLSINIFPPGDAPRQEYTINRPGPYLDSGIIPIALRNMPLEDRAMVTFDVIDVLKGSFYTPIATVTGSEVVVTDTTQYDCWVVNIGLPTGKVTAYYSKSDKHFLVKLRYTNNREIVLNHHS